MPRTRIGENDLKEPIQQDIESLRNIREERGAIDQVIVDLIDGNIKQKHKININGTKEEPLTIQIPLSNRIYQFIGQGIIDVLKFVPSETGVIEDIYTFANGDTDDFEDNKFVEFVDGKMKLKTKYEFPMTYEGQLGEGHLWSAPLDFSEFKTIESIEIV